MKRLFFTLMAITSLTFGDSSFIFSPGKSETEETDNEKVVEAFFQAFQRNNGQALQKTLAPNYSVTTVADIHQLASKQFDAGSNDLKVRMKAYHKAFPNLKVVVKELITAKDVIVAKVTFNGMQKGTFLGVAPTNRYLNIYMLAIIRLEDGKITEIEEMLADYNLMRQMGFFIF